MTGPAEGDVARRLERLTGAAVRELRPAGSQHAWRHYRASFADGREVFVKAAGSGLGGVFGAEARGLRWLGQAGAVSVPEVIGWDEATLVVSWVPTGTAGPAAAERFGRDLARMHLAGAARFGAPWPGFIASLPLPNGCAPADVPDGSCPSDAGELPHGAVAGQAGARRSVQAGQDPWPEWYAAHRILPYLRRAAGAGTLAAADVRLVEAAVARIGALAGPPEPPSRIHGDCWSGNVLWSGGRGWLIDPAAHGGHRETDLAMLALFGAPYLDRIRGSYQEVAPLAPGWRSRVPLHQLHPLAVHVCLFGASYRGALLDAARATLAA